VNERDGIGALRAHHVMCVTTFAGKGYSSGFVQEMTRIWRAIRAGTVARVRVTAEADPVCNACPHLQDVENPESCRFHASVASRDRRMIEAMGWTEGQPVDLVQALDVVHESHTELMARVCTGCEWVPICSLRRFTLREQGFDPESPKA
jgi:hypothetical protein